MMSSPKPSPAESELRTPHGQAGDPWLPLCGKYGASGHVSIWLTLLRCHGLPFGVGPVRRVPLHGADHSSAARAGPRGLTSTWRRSTWR